MRKGGVSLGLSVLALAAASPAAAQAQELAPYDRAIAAGYKALTLCSGIFNAGRTPEQMAGDELRGTYPQYDALLPSLDAVVDRANGRVSVAFDSALPARRAEWQAARGCTILPIGATGGDGQAPAPITGADPRPWPMGDKGIGTKIAAPLAATIATAFDAKSFGAGTNTTGIVVVQDGKIVGERYRAGFGPFVAQRTWSVAKSMTGTLVGMAVQQGVVATAAPAPIPEWGPAARDPRSAITIDNLLRMASGLHSATAGNRTDALYFGGTAVTEETTGWPIEALPGSRFRYANNDTLLAVRSLRAALGEEAYQAFPRTALFDKLGMRHTVAEADWRGNFILSSQVWSTARDLARLGMLYLNKGVWNGERLLPENWTDYVTAPSGPQPEGEFGYGASFWLLNRSAGVPVDSYAAFGNRGQYVVIVPSRNIVIVRRGEDPTGARFDVAGFTAKILATIR